MKNYTNDRYTLIEKNNLLLLINSHPSSWDVLRLSLQKSDELGLDIGWGEGLDFGNFKK